MDERLLNIARMERDERDRRRRLNQEALMAALAEVDQKKILIPEGDDGIDRNELISRARAVTAMYTAAAEDSNDGSFALWREDDLINAIVSLRQLVGINA